MKIYAESNDPKRSVLLDQARMGNLLTSHFSIIPGSVVMDEMSVKFTAHSK